MTQSTTLKIIIITLCSAMLIYLGYKCGNTNKPVIAKHTTDSVFVAGKPDTVIIYKHIKGREVVKPVVIEGRVTIDTAINNKDFWLSLKTANAADSVRIDYEVKQLETQIVRVDTLKIMDSVVVRVREPTKFLDGFLWGAVSGIVASIAITTLSQ